MPGPAAAGFEPQTSLDPSAKEEKSRSIRRNERTRTHDWSASSVEPLPKGYIGIYYLLNQTFLKQKYQEEATNKRHHGYPAPPATF
jgi:hypothetical protein